MATFLFRRFLEAIPVTLLATVIIFLGMRLIPGDPALVLAGQDASPETLAAIRAANGLDQPLPVQYVIWLTNAVHADFGVSFFTKAPVAQLIAQRAPATLELGLAAMLLTVLLSVPTGVVAAVRQSGAHRLAWIGVQRPGGGRAELLAGHSGHFAVFAGSGVAAAGRRWGFPS